MSDLEELPALPLGLICILDEPKTRKIIHTIEKLNFESFQVLPSLIQDIPYTYLKNKNLDTKVLSIYARSTYAEALDQKALGAFSKLLHQTQKDGVIILLNWESIHPPPYRITYKADVLLQEHAGNNLCLKNRCCIPRGQYPLGTLKFHDPNLKLRTRFERILESSL